MKKIFLFFFLIFQYHCFVAYGSQQKVEEENSKIILGKKCLGSLNYFNKINKSNPRFNRLLQGNIGSVIINLAKNDNDIMRNFLNKHENINYIGNKEDIYTCVNFGIPVENIRLFLLSFHGYLPKNPESEINKCYSTLYFFESKINNKLGIEKAKKVWFF